MNLLSTLKKVDMLKKSLRFLVSWEGGIEEFSGLLDVALAGGYVVKPSNGWYQVVNKESETTFWQ